MIREDPEMLNNLRNPIPGIENAGEMVKKAAIDAAQVAKDATNQIEDWAKDGYDSAMDAVKTKPVMLGAASLGFGALIGGLYALWQRGATKTPSRRKTLPVRARAKQSLRATTGMNGNAAPKAKAKRSKRAPRSMNA
jgi:hypothetical protein